MLGKDSNLYSRRASRICASDTAISFLLQDKVWTHKTYTDGTFPQDGGKAPCAQQEYTPDANIPRAEIRLQ